MSDAIEVETPVIVIAAIAQLKERAENAEAELERVRADAAAMHEALESIKDSYEKGDGLLDVLGVSRRALAANPGAVILAELEQMRIALGKINDIRNSIVGAQAINWSEHIFPLVAALEEAGLKGMDPGQARANVGTLIDRISALESENAALRARVEAVTAEKDDTQKELVDLAQWLSEEWGIFASVTEGVKHIDQQFHIFCDNTERCAAAVVAAEDKLAAAEARVEAVTREKDEAIDARGFWHRQASRIEEERDDANEQLAAAERRAGEAETMLRREFWVNHQCPPAAMYGDDGEMQCGACATDFKRIPIDDLIKHVKWLRADAIGRAFIEGRVTVSPSRPDDGGKGGA